MQEGGYTLPSLMPRDENTVFLPGQHGGQINGKTQSRRANIPRKETHRGPLWVFLSGQIWWVAKLMARHKPGARIFPPRRERRNMMQKNQGRLDAGFLKEEKYPKIITVRCRMFKRGKMPASYTAGQQARKGGAASQFFEKNMVHMVNLQSGSLIPRHEIEYQKQGGSSGR